MGDATSPKAAAAPAKPRARPTTTAGPSTLSMVLEAIGASTDNKGATVPSIKNFITEKYPSVDPNMLKFRLKKALDKGLTEQRIMRPKADVEKGAALSGRFRLNKAKIEADEKAKAKAKKEVEKKKTAKPKTAEKSTKKKSTTKDSKIKKTPTKVKKVVKDAKSPSAAAKKAAAKKITEKAKKTTEKAKKAKAAKALKKSPTKKSAAKKTPTKKTPTKKTPTKKAAKK